LQPIRSGVKPRNEEFHIIPVNQDNDQLLDTQNIPESNIISGATAVLIRIPPSQWQQIETHFKKLLSV